MCSKLFLQRQTLSAMQTPLIITYTPTGDKEKSLVFDVSSMGCIRQFTAGQHEECQA
jgi:hypothetical protein